MSFSLTDAMAILERTPELLQAWLAPLDRGWTNQNEGPGTFSAFDVVGHLIEGERTDWMLRTRILLEHGEAAVFPEFDRWAQDSRNRDRSFGELLEEFTRLRCENLTQLRALALSKKDLSATGTHPEFG
ncbi:MAG: DinB family protein [Planctomycetota bacterium]